MLLNHISNIFFDLISNIFLMLLIIIYLVVAPHSKSLFNLLALGRGWPAKGTQYTKCILRTD